MTAKQLYIANMLAGLLVVSPAIAQPSRDSVTAAVPQCSAIRELVFSAYRHRFDNLVLEREKGSQGYQTRGTWRFETTTYMSRLQWPGADRSYIDHSEETTDSSRTLIRQFVAEYGQSPTALQADRFFDALNLQIGECRVSMRDTALMVLQPLPAKELPEGLPPGVHKARVYPVQWSGDTGRDDEPDVAIMTAVERRRNRYVVYLIVEYQLRQGMGR